MTSEKQPLPSAEQYRSETSAIYPLVAAVAINSLTMPYLTPETADTPKDEQIQYRAEQYTDILRDIYSGDRSHLPPKYQATSGYLPSSFTPETTQLPMTRGGSAVLFGLGPKDKSIDTSTPPIRSSIDEVNLGIPLDLVEASGVDHIRITDQLPKAATGHKAGGLYNPFTPEAIYISPSVNEDSHYRRRSATIIHELFHGVQAQLWGAGHLLLEQTPFGSNVYSDFESYNHEERPAGQATQQHINQGDVADTYAHTPSEEMAKIAEDIYSPVHTGQEHDDDGTLVNKVDQELEIYANYERYGSLVKETAYTLAAVEYVSPAAAEEMLLYMASRDDFRGKNYTPELPETQDEPK